MWIMSPNRSESAAGRRGCELPRATAAAALCRRGALRFATDNLHDCLNGGEAEPSGSRVHGGLAVWRSGSLRSWMEVL